MLVCLKRSSGRQEAEGRSQANGIKGGGMLNLCDIHLLEALQVTAKSYGSYKLRMGVENY